MLRIKGLSIIVQDEKESIIVLIIILSFNLFGVTGIEESSDYSGWTWPNDILGSFPLAHLDRSGLLPYNHSDISSFVLCEIYPLKGTRLALLQMSGDRVPKIGFLSFTFSIALSIW